MKLQSEFPAIPKAAAEAEARQTKVQKITQGAAANIRAEMKEMGDKATERQHDLVKAAAVEYLQPEYGNKQKPAPNALQEKLKKACGCHLTLKGGATKTSVAFTL